MKKLLFFALYFLCINSIKAHSQDIVVSEYLNDTTYYSEWSELLVVKDNLSIVGYKIRDNTTNFSSDYWNSWFVFKNKSLWRNLRVGTIIVLRHSGAANIDIDPSDGYIELGLQDTNFFTPYKNNTTYFNAYLDISKVKDIIELLDSSGAHVHCLSHFNGASAFYDSISPPKVKYSIPIVAGIPTRSNVGVYPGGSIAGYDGSGAINSLNPSDSNIKGLPNYIIVGDTANSNFWRTLREPKWSAPNLAISADSLGASLIWNSAIDANPSDYYQGYLVVKCEKNFIANYKSPIDGKIYNKGDSLGAGLVISSLKGSQRVSFTDSSKLECGKSYVYRVFAYRYDKDQILAGTSAWSSRGRQYNQSVYAEDEIYVEPVVKPIINGGTPEIYICRGESAQLWAPKVSEYSYQWSRNDTLIKTAGAANIYNASESGNYKVIVKNKFNCVDSAEIKLNVVPIPKTTLAYNNENVARDTAIEFCGLASLVLKASGAEKIAWINNGALLSSGDSCVINKSGVYRAIGSNGSICFDTSYSLSVIFKDDDYSLEADTLSYYLTCGKSDTKIIVFCNNTTYAKHLTISHSLSDFTAPSVFLLPSMACVQLKISFTPTKAGSFCDTLYIAGECGRIDTFILRGYKESEQYSVSAKSIVFPEKVLCESAQDTVITIYKVGANNIILSAPLADSAFSCVFGSTPNISDSLSITIRFAPLRAGAFSSILKIPYTCGDCSDTIEIALSGSAFEPNIKIDKSAIIFPELVDCSQSDSAFIEIENINLIDIAVLPQISNDSSNAFTSSFDSVLIASGAKALVKIVFNPKSNSYFSGSLELKISPCEQLVSIPLAGLKNSLSFSFLPQETLDFGNISLCKASSAKKEISFSYSGEASDSIIIASIETPNGVMANYKAGDTLKNNSKIELSIESGFIGQISANVKIALNKCDYSQTFNIKANIYDNFALLSEELDFDTLKINVGKIDSFAITNTSFEPITISSISISNLVFRLLDTPVFTMAQNETKFVKYSFSSSVEGEFIDTASVLISEPCNKQYSIKLRATANNIIYYYSASIPNSIKYTPPNEVEIPIYFSINQARVAKSIDSIYFRISRDITITEPYRAESDYFYEPDITKDGADFSITLIPKNALNFDSSGVCLARIKARTYIGDSSISSIYFDSIRVYSSENFAPEIISGGTLEIVDICMPDLRILKFSEGLKKVLVASHDGGLGLQFFASAETAINIKIIDILGRELKNIENIEVPSGESLYSVTSLYRGAAFIIIGNNGRYFREKVMIQ